MGLAVRMAGSGGQVVIARFIKNDESGEVEGLRQVTGIQVLPCDKTFGFTWQMSEEQKKEASEYYEGLLEKAVCETELCVKNSKRVLLVLDEICAAVRSGLVKETQVLEAINCLKESAEIVMTGREPSEQLKEQADYISEIHKIKHPYDRGLTARKGIEY